MVAAPSGASIRITAPATNATLPRGDLRVTYDVTNASLVAASQATRVEDLHVHVLLDVDPTPYLGTTTFIPLNRPDIIHTPDREVTFQNVSPGQRRISVILTGANHVSVRPPVSDSVTFTVQ